MEDKKISWKDINVILIDKMIKGIKPVYYDENNKCNPNEMTSEFFNIPKGEHSFEQILALFKNGQERYQKDAVFNKCVNALYRGSNPIELLDGVLNINQELQEKLTEYVKYNGIPTINKIKK